MVQLSSPDRDAVRRAFGYAMEAFEMAEGSEEEPGDDDRSRIDREILEFVTRNRSEVAALLGRSDPELVDDRNYLRVAELGFRAIIARGRVTVEEMEADRKRMLSEIESYRPPEGELTPDEMKDWLEVQKALARRFEGEVTADEVAKEINDDYAAAERLLPVVKEMLGEKTPAALPQST